MGFTIAWDASAAAKRERTGVARAAAALIDAMLAQDQDDRFVLGCRWSRLRRAAWRLAPTAKNCERRWFSDALLPLPLVGLGRIDLFHGLDGRIPARGSFKKIATLHDLGPLQHDGIAGADFRAKKRAAYETIARHADKIICVSASTRDAFRVHHPLPPERFEVIHHGVDPRFQPCDAATISEVRARHRLGPHYLLFVGLVSARKNLANLVRAFDRAAMEHPDVQLALVGGDAHGAAEVDDAIASARHGGRVARLGFVPDADLPALYSGATAFVFPGLTEGFGMPMLEAMACGTPVIAAAAPVSHEVAGDAALLADCTASEPLAIAMLSLLNRPERRATLIARGWARTHEFTWGAAARKTLAVYRSVLGHERPGKEEGSR